MCHPKGACPKGGSTNHNQGEGVGADYVNLALQNTVSPQTVLISKRWVQSVYLTTDMFQLLLTKSQRGCFW